MLVNSVPVLKQPKNLSFKAVGVGDLGAHGGANIGIAVNNEMTVPKGTRVDSSSADRFLETLSEQWKAALKGHENEPNRIAQCLNGPIKNGEWYGTNVRDNNGQPLKIKVDDLKQAIENKGVAVENFVICNDGAFMGGAALRQIKNVQEKDLNRMFPPGTETPFIFPGGGLGVGEIRGTKDSIEIIPREKGHLSLNINDSKTIEAELTSVPAMIRNFAKSAAVGLDEQKANRLAKSGVGQIVTSLAVKLDNLKDAKDLAALPLELFEVKKEGQTTTLVLKDKDGLPITQEQHDKAFAEASDKFYDGIGKVIHDYVAGGKTNKAVLTGQFVGHILQHSRDLGQNPKKLIMNAVRKNSDPVCKNLIQDGFEIIHAPVKDGTSGGALIANSKDDNNGAWFSLKRADIDRI